MRHNLAIPKLQAVSLASVAAVTSDTNGSAVDLVGYDGMASVVLMSAAGSSDTLSTNGTFAADSGWTKGTGWTIGSGVATCDGTQTDVSDLKQNQSLTEGVTYTVTYTISSRSAGTLTPRLGGTAGVSRSANGTYVELITCGAGADPKLEFRADADFAGSLDNVSVMAASMAVHLEHSADGSTSWSDITGASFATVYGLASAQRITINTDECKRYIRPVFDITGASATFTLGVTLLGIPQGY